VSRKHNLVGRFAHSRSAWRFEGVALMDATDLEALDFRSQKNSQQPAHSTLVPHAHMGIHSYSVELRYGLDICTASTVSSAM
jgi:hypothetical protein